LETQILLAGDLDLIEKGELGTLNKAIADRKIDLGPSMMIELKKMETCLP